MKMYSIYDKKMNTFAPVMCAEHLVVIQRELQTIVNTDRQGNSYCQFSEDYDLYFMGEFDQNEGSFKTPDKPVFVQNLNEFKAGFNPEKGEKENE